MGARSWVPLTRTVWTVLLVLLASGCLGSSWEAVRRSNTVGSYHHFLRDNPRSPYASEAQQRIAFLRVTTHPSLEGFERFASSYPDSLLLAELRAHMEPLFFTVARTQNSAASYRSFLERYPEGASSAKARGNLAYVDSVRDHVQVERMERFIEEHPESDFVAEARRTLELLSYHKRTRIEQLAIRIDVAPNVTQPSRVRHGFAALVARHYEERGVKVGLIPAGQGPPAGIDAWMRVDYHEAPASGTFGGRTLVAHCRMRLYHRDSKDPIWDRKFEAPAEHVLQGAYGRDKTIFANSGYEFWENFFVPVSTWATSGVRQSRFDYPEEVVSIDVVDDVAALLYERGGVDFMNVSTPLEPEVLHRYRRQRDLTRWSGIRLITDRLILTYGPDGVELIERGELQLKRIAAWELPEVGSISSADLWGSTLLFAGTKGVFAVRLESRPLRPSRLLEGEFVGIFVRKPYIYLVRPNQLELTTPKHLLQHLTGARLPLGEKFGANRARMGDGSIYVFGKDKVLEVSLANPGRPKVVSEMTSDLVGVVGDMTWDAGHLYLLGDRGLEVMGPNGQWVADAIQLDADQALARKGRFLFAVGGRTLEVLDLAPYQVAVASPVR